MATITNTQVVDHTQQAAEALVSARLPSDGYPHHLATDKTVQDFDEVDVIEIIADPYTVDTVDEQGVPVWATLTVLVNYTSANNRACEQFLRMLSGAVFGFTPETAAELIAQLPDPFSRLEVYAIDATCNGMDVNVDDTFTAQYQINLTLRPLLFYLIP